MYKNIYKNDKQQLYNSRKRMLKTGEEIYKIGKTKQEGTKRINQYPKESEIILLMKV